MVKGGLGCMNEFSYFRINGKKGYTHCKFTLLNWNNKQNLEILIHLSYAHAHGAKIIGISCLESQSAKVMYAVFFWPIIVTILV